MSEAEPRSALRELLSGGAAQIGAALTGFAVFPVLTWLLDDQQLGAWSLIATVALMLGLANLGLEMAVQRAVVGENAVLARRCLGFSLLSLLVLGAPLAILLVLTQLDFSSLSDEMRTEAWYATAVALLAGACSAASLPYQSFVYARGGHNFIAAARASASLTQVLLLSGFLLWRSLLVPAAALLCANLVELSLTTRAARHFDPEVPLGPRMPQGRSEMWTMLRDGLAQVSINFAVVMADRVDLFVLRWATALRRRREGAASREASAQALAAVGQYYIAGNVISKAYKLTKQANTVLIRRLGDPEERVAALTLGTAVFGGLILAGMSAAAFDAQEFLIMVLGDKASTEIVTVALLLLGCAHMVMATYEVASSTVMLGSRTAWGCAVPIIVGSTLNLVIALGGGPRFGVWAVAGSTLVGNLVIALLMWTQAKRLLALSIPRVLRILLPVAASGAVASGFALLLRDVAATSGFHSLGVSVFVSVAGVLTTALTVRGLGDPV